MCESFWPGGEQSRQVLVLPHWLVWCTQWNSVRLGPRRWQKLLLEERRSSWTWDSPGVRRHKTQCIHLHSQHNEWMNECLSVWKAARSESVENWTTGIKLDLAALTRSTMKSLLPFKRLQLCIEANWIVHLKLNHIMTISGPEPLLPPVMMQTDSLISHFKY